MITTFFTVLLAGATSAIDGFDLSGAPAHIESGKSGQVIVFLSARCPCSNSHLSTLKALAEKHKDFSFVGVHSNGDEPQAEAQSYFAKSALPFPILQDRKFALANRFKAMRTPHAFVINTKGETVYRGGVTDSAEAKEAEHQRLGEALEDIEAHRNVRVAQARSLGCAISRSENETP